jgi:hypothetical protein
MHNYDQSEWDLYLHDGMSEVWASFLTIGGINDPEKDEFCDWYWAWEIFTKGWYFSEIIKTKDK